jgi:hypothetical protein
MFSQHTTVEYKTVDPDLFISRNANVLDEIFHVTQRTERGHEPTISLFSLSNVVGGGALDEELRLVKNVLFVVRTWSGRRYILQMYTPPLV